MTRRYVDPDSIEGQLADSVDDVDYHRELVEHVLGDDRPPQGLHRQGFKIGDDE